MDTDNFATNTVDDHIQSEMNENIQILDDNDSEVRINACMGHHTLNIGMLEYLEEKTCNQMEKGVQTEWSPVALYKDGMTRRMSGRVCTCHEVSSNGSRCTVI